MKKIILFLLVFSLCFFIFSCANQQKKDTENTTANKTEQSEKIPTDDEYTPPENDNNSMFVYPKDPAKFVVDYITEMATIEWTPQKTFHLYGKYQAWKYDLIYETGETYYGPPFLVDSRGTMQEFKNSLENNVYIGGTTLNNCIGDACYDAVYVSLIQVCPSITFKSTEDMLPKNNTGLVAVGDWDINITKTDTPTIIYETSRQTMAKSYAQLLPGDVVLKHVVIQDAGHARIVNSKPVVVYNDDGTIDLEKSYITTVEQTNLWDETTRLKTTWWVNRKYTFNKLIDTYFVPLRPVDYTKELPDAYISTNDIISEDEIKDATSLKGTVFSNQYIIEVSVEVTDASGNKVYKQSAYPNEKEYDLKKLKYRPREFNHIKGEYNLKISASLSTGTKTLCDYNFTLD